MLEDLLTILEKCKENNRKSQEKLYKLLYPALYTLCKSFFNDPHDIVTAINNGMLKVFKNVHQYSDSKGSFFNWAYTIVRNCALTMVRNKATKTIESHELDNNSNVSNIIAINPFSEVEVKAEVIYSVLNQLPIQTRMICRLHYLEGFSIKEIANGISMKEGTIKWHLYEGRTRLKLLFDNKKLNLKGA